MKNSIESSSMHRISTESILIAFMGDFMIGRLVNDVLKERDPISIWGDLLPILKKADLKILNFEAALTTCKEMVPKVFNFKTDPKNVNVLTKAGIDLVNLANNHILDFTEEGLYDSLQILNEAGILHVGAGKTLAEATQPMVIEKKGIKIGVIGCTDNEPGWEAGVNEPGTFYVASGEIEKISKEVSKIRNEVDFLILTMHWGPNMRQRPTHSFQTFAHLIIDHGIDVIHGHSAHIFQGVEVYKERAILYDTGDFVDDYAIDPYLRNDCSFLFILEVVPKKVLSIRLIPVVIENFSVRLAFDEEKRNICKRMKEFSLELNTVFEETDWGLIKKL